MPVVSGQPFFLFFPFFSIQPCPAYLPDSVGDQQPPSGSTAISSDFPFSLPIASPAASHDAHSECAAGSDKLAAIRSPPHDVVSDTPISGSDEEDSKISLPSHDVEDNFSLKLSTEGSDTASTPLSVEPEVVPIVGEKSAAALEKSVVSQVSQELDSKVEEVSTSCVMASKSAEQDNVPVTSDGGSDQGPSVQADVSSLDGKDQLSETVLSTREDAVVSEGGDEVEDSPVLLSVSYDKSEDSNNGKQLNKRSSSSRTTKKRVSETKASSLGRKYITRKSVTSSTSATPSPLQQPCPPANQQLCEEQHALPIVQSGGNEDEVKKPLAAVRGTDTDEAEEQTALLVPSTNSLTIITSTYSMSATFVSDTAPSDALPTTTSSISTLSTPSTSTPLGQEIKLLPKRGRGRPRKQSLVQGDGLSREKADSRNQRSLDGNVKPYRQKRDGQTAVEQEVTGEDVHGRDAKKMKMSDPSDDKQTERRRSLRERVRTPLLEESGIFTQKRKPRKSSSSCSMGRGPESTAKSSKDTPPKKGSSGSSRTSSSGQQISPISQSRAPRRNSSRSYARSPRKKQASRRSDEGILPIHRNWLCALCNHGNSCNGLGYLYGPYRCHEMNERSADKSSPEKGNL